MSSRRLPSGSVTSTAVDGGRHRGRGHEGDGRRAWPARTTRIGPGAGRSAAQAGDPADLPGRNAQRPLADRCHQERHSQSFGCGRASPK